MKKPSPAFQFTVYGLLVIAGLLFAFPLLWMVLTSLKPIDQTMASPPVWIPRSDTIQVDGQPIDVILESRVWEPSVYAEVLTGPRKGERVLIPAAAFNPDDPAIREIKRAESGWWIVSERSKTMTVTGSLVHDVVPPHAISSQTRWRWENYPVALRAMAGGSIGVAEGTVAKRTPNPETDVTFMTFVLNTLIVCIFGVIGTVFSNALVAYGFARLKWPGRDAFFAITLATMMIPFPVMMVPLYGIFKELGWVGTLLPLWVPAWFGSAFNIFLMRQFFRTIPEDLSEAARIDGASEWGIFWRIILPLSKPVLAVAALFHFLYAWNDFLGPLLYLTRKPTFTLALALQNFQSQHGGVQWHHLMAASVVTVLPVIVLFFFTQKTFVRGIATTGSKN